MKSRKLTFIWKHKATGDIKEILCSCWFKSAKAIRNLGEQANTYQYIGVKEYQ